MYGVTCIFSDRFRCPLARFSIEVDGNLCAACTDVLAVLGMRTQVIAQLLMTYQNEEKALNVFKRVKKCAVNWG